MRLGSLADRWFLRAHECRQELTVKNSTGVKRIEHRTLTKAGITMSQRRATLRVLATTDLHMNLLGYDYYANKPDPGVGLSRCATLIAQARIEAAETGAATLLVDNGDALQGTPLGDLPDTTRPHPLMRAFQVLKYDAVGLGNHDFNYGLETLTRVLNDAPCPAICSNMSAMPSEQPLPFVSSAVLERQFPNTPDAPQLKIGLLSVLPQQTLQWDAHLLSGRVNIADMVQTARNTSAALRTEGCDVVIALAHSGLSHKADASDTENALHLLAELDDIDALIGGHTHLLLPDAKFPFSKPVVMPGAHGSHLGVIDLQLSHNSDGWKVDDWDCELRSIAKRNQDGRLENQVAEDTTLAAALAQDHQATLDWMQQPVGHSPQPLYSFFTFFAPDRALALVANAQAAALRPLLKGGPGEDLPLLSAVSPCKFGARAGPGSYTDVAAGPLCRRHVADLHVFPNRLSAAILSGSQVLEWLEMSASLFNQVTPGTRDTVLVNSDWAGHNFDVLHGLEYQIDLSFPARFHSSGQLADSSARRIRHASWNNQPLSPDQKFVVALNSHRAGGGGNFAVLPQAEHLSLPSHSIQQAIFDYLSGNLPTDPLSAASAPWSFSSHPDTEVVAFTGPAAQSHLHELTHLNLAPPQITPDGFLKLQIPL